MVKIINLCYVYFTTIKLGRKNWSDPSLLATEEGRYRSGMEGRPALQKGAE